MERQNPVNQMDSVAGNVVLPMFCFFSALTPFALANCITGVFVGQAINTSQEYYDDMLINYINVVVERSNCNIEAQWGFDQFEKMANLPSMTAVFKACNMDGGDSKVLFNLLDEDADGYINYLEFVAGCLKLRGPAKSLELTLFQKKQETSNRTCES